MNNDWDEDDHEVRAQLLLAADNIAVDVDVEWAQLVDVLAGERAVLASLPRTQSLPRFRLGRPLLVAAAIVIVLLALRPTIVEVAVTVADRLAETVGLAPEEDAGLAPLPPSTTIRPVILLPPTTVPQPPPTTIPPPPPLTTLPVAAPPSTDLAHSPILDGNEYRLTLRRVHDQLNQAIGFGRTNYEALAGSDRLVEDLLGQQPRFDSQLRDTIGHLRQAQRARDRAAASQAHTIIDGVQKQLATEAQ